MPTIGRSLVVGGSVAGLAAAAHLARHSAEVLVVERHALTDNVTVAPHGAQPHILLAAGAHVLDELFPGAATALIAAGADEAGGDPTRIPGRWAAAGAVRDHIALPGNTAPAILCSRSLLEAYLRTAVRSLPNVAVVHDHAQRLAVDAPLRVTGIHLRDAGLVEADLVIDATGRTAPLVGTPEVPSPPTSEVAVDVRYTSYVVERRAGDFGGGSFCVVQNTPHQPRGGVAVPREGGAWQIALAGYFGDSAPADPAGARAHAATLADPALVEMFDRPFLEPPRRYHFRSSLRRHWERLGRQHLPGYVPIGDTVASFNPIYGQGMSSALLQARALGRAVEHHGTAPALSARMARECARTVAGPWTIATGGDFVYRQTNGKRPVGQTTVNAYVERLLHAAAYDEEVNAVFSRVQQLLAPPTTLFAPRIIARVLRPRAGRVAEEGSGGVSVRGGELTGT